MSDLSKMYVDDGVKEVVINHRGEEFKFKVKEISWMRKTEIAGRSTKHDSKTGQSSIALDKYNLEYLSEIIVEAPWGNKPTKIELLKLNSDFGTLLAEKLIAAVSTDDVENGEGLKKA